MVDPETPPFHLLNRGAGDLYFRPTRHHNVRAVGLLLRMGLGSCFQNSHRACPGPSHSCNSTACAWLRSKWAWWFFSRPGLTFRWNRSKTPCILDAFTEGNCTLTNLSSCLCPNISLQAGVSACVQQQCPFNDQVGMNPFHFRNYEATLNPESSTDIIHYRNSCCRNFKPALWRLSYWVERMGGYQHSHRLCCHNLSYCHTAMYITVYRNTPALVGWLGRCWRYCTYFDHLSIPLFLFGVSFLSLCWHTFSRSFLQRSLVYRSRVSL